MKLVNKISQNLHSEALLRTAMRQKGTWNSFDEVSKFAADFYDQVGIAPEDIIQTDGSGLSRHDMVTPRAMLTLLRYAQTRPWFESFFASLPVAGVDVVEVAPAYDHADITAIAAAHLACDLLCLWREKKVRLL